MSRALRGAGMSNMVAALAVASSSTIGDDKSTLLCINDVIAVLPPSSKCCSTNGVAEGKSEAGSGNDVAPRAGNKPGMVNVSRL